MQREFRIAKTGKLGLKFNIGEVGSDEYNVEFLDMKEIEKSKELAGGKLQDLIALVEEKPMNLAELSEQLNKSKKTVRTMIERALDLGIIVVDENSNGNVFKKSTE